MDHPYGIPTRYKGRQYRSRLEARWACFFDLLGWRYEYEPCDFEGWIPDFVLCEALSVFVEVKPVTTFPKSAADKIEATSCATEVLIVGSTLFPRWSDGCLDFQEPALGWLRETWRDEDDDLIKGWGVAVFGQWEASGRMGFCHLEQSYRDRISGLYTGSPMDCDYHTIQGCWTQAGNETQWRSGFAPLSTHLSSRLSTTL